MTDHTPLQKKKTVWIVECFNTVSKEYFVLTVFEGNADAQRYIRIKNKNASEYEKSKCWFERREIYKAYEIELQPLNCLKPTFPGTTFE